MDCNDYKIEVEKRGTQAEVAKLLGLRQATISDRITGKQPIKKEAEMAIKALPLPVIKLETVSF